MVPENLVDKQEAEPILIRIGKSTFHLLIYKKKLYIFVNEGLRLIGVDINWIPLDPKDRRGRILKKVKFSFDRKLLCYQIGYQGNLVFVETYLYSARLGVWSYFVSRCNTKAINLLKSLAGFGLNQYLKTWSDADVVSGVHH
jgi:hypothetical protein